MVIVRKHKRKLKKGYSKVKSHKRKVKKRKLRWDYDDGKILPEEEPISKKDWRIVKKIMDKSLHANRIENKNIVGKRMAMERIIMDDEPLKRIIGDYNTETDLGEYNKEAIRALRKQGYKKNDIVDYLAQESRQSANESNESERKMNIVREIDKDFFGI